MPLGAADPRKIPIDPNGNLTTKTEGSDTWTYEWNAENRLTRVTKNSVEQARFAYDPAGRRVEKVAGGVTTSYAYDQEDILREVRGPQSLRYVHGPEIDEPLATDDGTALSYLHADGLASVVKATNGTGAVTLARQYDAWGNLEAGKTEPGYAFTGREWNPESDLYYYRARYYDPRTGTFVAPDPIKFNAGVNFYAYVRGNPATFIDSLGLELNPPQSWQNPTWRPPASCEVEIGFQARALMRGGNGTRFSHCWASCEITKKCPGGAGSAEQWATNKEWWDWAWCFGGYGPKGSCDSAHQPTDYEDNYTGRLCPKSQDCWTRCQKLIGAGEPPAGPYGKR